MSRHLALALAPALLLTACGDDSSDWGRLGELKYLLVVRTHAHDAATTHHGNGARFVDEACRVRLNLVAGQLGQAEGIVAIPQNRAAHQHRALMHHAFVGAEDQYGGDIGRRLFQEFLERLLIELHGGPGNAAQPWVAK